MGSPVVSDRATNVPCVSRFTVNKKAQTFCVSRFTVNKKAQSFTVNKKAHYSEIWLFAPSVCLVSLLTRKPKLSFWWARGEPVALTLTALAPQLFRDLVVRSFCVSRFTVNKKAQSNGPPRFPRASTRASSDGRYHDARDKRGDVTPANGLAQQRRARGAESCAS